MTDPRISNLAKLLVHYSTKVNKGDKVLIRGFPLEPNASPLVMEIIREVLKAGGHPHPLIDLEDIRYYFISEASDAQLLEPNMFIDLASKEMDVDIRLTSSSNLLRLTNTDPGKHKLIRRAYSEIIERVSTRTAAGDLRWVATRYPSQSMAQVAEMSLPEYEDFFYGATYANTQDAIGKWKELGKEQERLVDWLAGKENVHIEGDGVDLKMSVKDRTFINCCGLVNMPDGEIFTGPVEESVEGKVKFSYPCIYVGVEVDGVELEFEKGKVVKASAEKNEEYFLETIASDEGASFVGELGIGTNYEIDTFTRNMLFDEKMGGTIHLALGRGYPESGSKNKSAIHWDLLTDMKDGGKITIDGELFYESGQFKI
ncbi:MAG: aminopeptidase [Anaerolineales bacterium]|nr:aminopeptidase [Anaerolineales bacterium]